MHVLSSQEYTTLPIAWVSYGTRCFDFTDEILQNILSQYKQKASNDDPIHNKLLKGTSNN